MTRNGARLHLGTFETVEAASEAYCNVKAAMVESVAYLQRDIRLMEAMLHKADIIRSGKWE